MIGFTFRGLNLDGIIIDFIKIKLDIVISETLVTPLPK